MRIDTWVIVMRIENMVAKVTTHSQSLLITRHPSRSYRSFPLKLTPSRPSDR
jgi:hypothetical protein